MPANAAQASRPPAERLQDLLGGFRVSQLVYAAAALGLADRLAAGPADRDTLAGATGSRPLPLGAALDLLVEAGVFERRADGTYALNAVSERLRSDHPESLRELAIQAGEVDYRLWGELLTQLRPASDAARSGGTDWFRNYARGSDRRMYDDMATSAAALADHLADVYDFSGLGSVVDVGGGYGSALLRLLTREASLTGVVCDLAELRDEAERRIADAALEGRCRFEETDFFRSLPAGADAYLLLRVLRNWPDAGARELLESCRRSLTNGGRVLVVDPLRDDADPRQPLEVLDRRYLRSADELSELFAAAGLRLCRVVPLPAWGVVAEGELPKTASHQGDG